MAIGIAALTNLLRGGAKVVPRMAGQMPKALLKPGAVKVAPSTVKQLGSAGLSKAAPAAAATKKGGFNLLGGVFKAATSPVGQIGIAGATLAPFLMDLPYSTRKGILEAGPDSQGNFRPNIFQRAITGMDGDQFQSAYEQDNLEELLKDPTVRERMSLGIRTPDRDWETDLHPFQ